MTEKRKSTFNLDELKELVGVEKTRSITCSSYRGANKAGFTETEMVEAVLSLTRRDFYKSTTKHDNSRIWQDVYKTSNKEVGLYIKLQKSMEDDDKGICIVISFKKDEGAS